MTGATAIFEGRWDALALRRYTRERAAGRTAAEWVTYDDCLRAWIVAGSEAAATTSGRPWRRVRQPYEPWCNVLGRELAIASDDDLQAMFAAIGDDDPGAWRRLWLEADRAPARCLTDWRARGRRLLAAVTGEPVVTGETLAMRFAVRGTGKRGLAGI